MNVKDPRLIWALVINASIIIWAVVGCGIFLVVTNRLDIASASNVLGPLVGAMLTLLGAGGGFAAYHVSAQVKGSNGNGHAPGA